MSNERVVIGNWDGALPHNNSEIFLKLGTVHLTFRGKFVEKKPLTGMQKVLRPTWKIGMSIFIWTRTISMN